jgi:hypothetical protein
VDAHAGPRCLTLIGDVVKLQVSGDLRLRFESPVEPMRDGDTLTFEPAGGSVVVTV